MDWNTSLMSRDCRDLDVIARSDLIQTEKLVIRKDIEQWFSPFSHVPPIFVRSGTV